MVIKLSELTTGNLRMNIWKCKEYPQNPVVLCGSIWSWFWPTRYPLKMGNLWRSTNFPVPRVLAESTRRFVSSMYSPPLKTSKSRWNERGDLLGSSPFQPLVFGGAICMKHDLCMYGVQVFNNLHLRIYCNIFSRVSGNDFFALKPFNFWWTSDQKGTSLGYLWFSAICKINIFSGLVLMQIQSSIYVVSYGNNSPNRHINFWWWIFRDTCGLLFGDSWLPWFKIMDIEELFVVN